MKDSVYKIKTDVEGLYIQDYTVWCLWNSQKKKSYVLKH
jgi:hypothetical protein